MSITRDYSPHNLCGGGKFQSVHLGARPAPPVSRPAPRAREGRYKTRELEKLDWATCQALNDIKWHLSQRPEERV